MDFVQLHYFVETASRLHFARAAEQLGISQPALSKSIQKLEKELEFKLFSRANKWDIQLTVPGEVYLREARRILQDVAYAKNLALTAAHGESGRLVIGAISSMLGQDAFIDAVSESQRKTPRAVFEVIDSTSGELLALLKEHKIDLAFLRLPPKLSDEHFQCRKLFMDRLLAVVPKGHRLAAKEKISVDYLARERFVLVPDAVSGVFRSYILDFCRTKGGFEPNIVQEVNNNYTTLRLVAVRCGVTIVSSAYRGFLSEHLCYLPFADFQPELPMFAVCPSDRTSLLAEKFIQELLRAHRKRNR